MVQFVIVECSGRRRSDARNADGEGVLSVSGEI